MIQKWRAHHGQTIDAKQRALIEPIVQPLVCEPGEQYNYSRKPIPNTIFEAVQIMLPSWPRDSRHDDRKSQWDESFGVHEDAYLGASRHHKYDIPYRATSRHEEAHARGEHTSRRLSPPVLDRRKCKRKIVMGHKSIYRHGRYSRR
jgi:hypothetical protein